MNIVLCSNLQSHKLRNKHMGSNDILQRNQKSTENTAKCLKCLKSDDDSQPLLIRDIIVQEIIKFGWKLTNNQLPVSLEKCALSSADGASLTKNHGYHTRNKNIPNVPHVKNKSYKNSIFCKCISLFGNLPKELKSIKIYKVFCK